MARKAPSSVLSIQRMHSASCVSNQCLGLIAESWTQLFEEALDLIRLMLSSIPRIKKLECSSGIYEKHVSLCLSILKLLMMKQLVSVSVTIHIEQCALTFVINLRTDLVLKRKPK